MTLLSKKGDGHALYDWERRFSGEPPATVEALEGFFAHWEQAMIACGALNPAEPKFLMPMTRRMVARSGLTMPEVDLLRGICAAVICPREARAGRKGGKKKRSAQDPGSRGGAAGHKMADVSE